MSASSIATSYTIEWCRNWVPVSKIVKVSTSNCETVKFSDWWTETTPSLWLEGSCVWEGVDYETTCVAENSNLYYLKFDSLTNTYRVYDFNNVEVTWTVTPVPCAWNISSPTVPWAADILVDTLMANTLDAYIWTQFVKSFTLVSSVDTTILVNGNSKLLKEWQQYTWSQWETYNIDVSVIQFVTDWVTIEVIWEI